MTRVERNRIIEACARIAEHVYSDAVAAYGPDEPSVVGTKIARAIRKLKRRKLR